MEVTNIFSLVEYFKFGYTGNTIDLIYFLLVIRFFIFPLIKIILKKVKKGVFIND